jgi:hypothetical protein
MGANRCERHHVAESAARMRIRFVVLLLRMVPQSPLLPKTTLWKSSQSPLRQTPPRERGASDRRPRRFMVQNDFWGSLNPRFTRYLRFSTVEDEF